MSKSLGHIVYDKIEIINLCSLLTKGLEYTFSEGAGGMRNLCGHLIKGNTRRWFGMTTSRISRSQDWKVINAWDYVFIMKCNDKTTLTITILKSIFVRVSRLKESTYDKVQTRTTYSWDNSDFFVKKSARFNFYHI